VHNYLDLLLRGAAKDRGEVDASDEKKDSAPTGQRLQRKSALGGHGKDSTYRSHRKNPSLRQLVKKIYVSAPDAGDALRHGFPVELPELSLSDLQSACSEISNDMNETSLLTQEDVESAVSQIVATEYAAEPNVRRALRAKYRDNVTISTRPTVKGLNELTPFDPLFGLVYLDDMPVKEFFDRKKSLYMQLLQAEHDGFLIINCSKPLCTTGSYDDIVNTSSAFARIFGDLFAFFISQKTDFADMEAQQHLNGIRLKAMIDCCNNHLVPSLEEEVRRDLTRSGKEAIIDEACEKFSSLLRKGPYRPPAMDRREDIKDVLLSCPRRPMYATVVCIYFSANPRQPIAMVYCDKDGVMLASDLIPPRATSRKVEMLSSFVKTNQPDVIVVNASGGRASKSAVALFEKTLIKEISESLKEESQERMQMNDYYGADDEEDVYDPKVIMVKDEIAEIFKQSPRSKKMFPDFDPSLCAAVCLARFVQEPLAEYCNLWTSANSVGVFGIEALFLKLHPLLHMAKSLRATLLEKLQYCLVDAVCDVGVDINLAVSHDHLASLLIFVEVSDYVRRITFVQW
jgi:transcription elongation factor SPT6